MTSTLPRDPQESLHPYTALTPDVVLDALSSAGFAADGRLLALNSYENRVYRAHLDEDPPVVAKFYRPARWSDAQIEEEHAFLRELVEREVPAVAPFERDGRTLFEHAGFRFSVFPSRGGRVPNLEDREVLQWIGRYLGRIHAVGASGAFSMRPALDIESFGRMPRAWLAEHGEIPGDVKPAWESVADAALAGIESMLERVGDVPTLRLHGDCHAGNILWVESRSNTGPVFVDFDDARSGPAVQDLWMLLAGDRETSDYQRVAILAGYEEFRDFDRRELRLVETYRTLRLLHYSYWLASRRDDPAFPAAFPWFGTSRYWQDRILELREQTALLEDEDAR